MVNLNPFSAFSGSREPQGVLPSSYTPLIHEPGQTAETPVIRRRPFKEAILVLSGALLLGVVIAIIGKNGSNVCAKMRGSSSSVAPEILRPVSRGVSEGVSEKANRELHHSNVASFPWNNTMLSWQRSAFHFQPEKNWMSDPDGPLYHKGWYHFFYQYNPQSAVWGNIVWGHAVSRDLVNWLHLPLALVSDQWYEAKGVWTGSATILPGGQIMMLYTSATKELIQVQNLAYPANLSDPLLIKWEKYSGNPILFPPTGIYHKDFRDPTTAWLTPEGKWRIGIGSKLNRTGITLLYETEDFKNFVLLETLLHAVDGTGMWECVDLFPVSKTKDMGLEASVFGAEVRHVMKTSLDDLRHDHYALGTYDEKLGTWVPDDPKIDVGIGIRYDYGKFYASKTFYDPKKKRRVLWGWIGESDSEYSDLKKGWASLQAIPRTIVLDRKTESNLLLWPVEEIESLREGEQTFNNLAVAAGSVVPLDVGPATQLDIVAEFELDKEAVAKAPQTTTEFSCRNSGGAAESSSLGPFGFLLLADQSLTERTPVYFYVSKGQNGTLQTFFCADQSRSSEANDVLKPIYGSFVPVLDGEKLSVRILVDHSVIESFAQGGRTCITSRVYPTKAIYESARLFIFNNAIDAKVKASVKIWQMGPSFNRPYRPDQAGSIPRFAMGRQLHPLTFTSLFTFISFLLFILI